MLLLSIGKDTLGCVAERLIDISSPAEGITCFQVPNFQGYQRKQTMIQPNQFVLD